MDARKITEKIQTHKPEVLGSRDFAKFAILLPLIEKDGEIHVLFEKRAETLRKQPGEVCFPGGRIDPQDKSPESAALRETDEELGISEDEISAVFPLDYMVSPFGMIIYAFAGFINAAAEFKPNPAEVGELFSVPLSFFLENPPRVYQINFDVQPEESFPYDLIVGGRDYSWRTRNLEEYFYLYEDKVIWGLTARILSHFIDIIK
ncbi:CoA pyrophosphatase [Planococcus shenhongbingii]|uniref:CoA pyrophosphatase n=1 Tax=Planococcus shenhongbingii TaxID=3058398 RepID=A0ABT8NCZ7_9BACL|nr:MULTISPECIES: CoA pyrophosphatase [unclassified Planococcus (in: firmicutes)]MDN7245405.1 CoA pyrophosphatase [Planococcus sp. N017]WKA58502.1 CoA pyrophosphatase [Planococcus sp. N016]